MIASILSVVRRLGSGLGALANQAVVSLGSFLTIVLLGRELPQADYGLYSLTYAMMLFLNSIHGAIVVYPLLVKAAGRSPEAFAHLVGMSVDLTVLLNLVLAVALAGLLAGFGEASLTPWAVLAMLAAQLHETVRRAFMAQLRHGGAIWGDGVAYLGLPAVMLALSLSGALSLRNAFLAMAACFAVGGLVHAARIRRVRRPLREVWGEVVANWPVVRWMLVTNLVNLAGIQIMPWILAAFHGLDAVGTLRALVNLVAICHPLMFGLGNLIVPSVAHARASGGIARAVRVAMAQGAQGGALVLPYLIGLLLFPTPALVLFYGADSVYVGAAPALKWIVVGYGFMLASVVMEAVLKGMERSRDVFHGQLMSIGATVLGGAPLAAFYGVEGAMAGIMLSMAALFLWYLRIVGQLLADGVPVRERLARLMRAGGPAD